MYDELAKPSLLPSPGAPDRLRLALSAGCAELLSEAKMIKREKQSTALIKLAGTHLPDFVRRGICYLLSSGMLAV